MPLPVPEGPRERLCSRGYAVCPLRPLRPIMPFSSGSSAFMSWSRGLSCGLMGGLAQQRAPERCRDSPGLVSRVVPFSSSRSPTLKGRARPLGGISVHRELVSCGCTNRPGGKASAGTGWEGVAECPPATSLLASSGPALSSPPYLCGCRFRHRNKAARQVHAN